MAGLRRAGIMAEIVPDGWRELVVTGSPQREV